MKIVYVFRYVPFGTNLGALHVFSRAFKLNRYQRIFATNFFSTLYHQLSNLNLYYHKRIFKILAILFTVTAVYSFLQIYWV